ncbi:hypothetical protein ES703_11840 [subsurface metagenome]
MNDKAEAIKAIERINKIIHEWEENKIESRTALELIDPDIKAVISHVEELHERHE